MRGGYWLVGPADSTDGWKNWVATPVANRIAFQMRTQDRRIIGAGSITAPGSYFAYDANIAFFNPTRGTYLQTFYYYLRYGAGTTFNNGPLVAIGRTEMDMLKAEALIRLGRAAEALPLINKTRVANGKLPADRHQRTTGRRGCVPRKTTGACGGLWGALRDSARGRWCRWASGVLGRARLEHTRPNSFIQFPIPGRELEIQRQSVYTYGGGGAGSAPTPTWDKCPASVTLARCS
jgi:hypothetical protein